MLIWDLIFGGLFVGLLGYIGLRIYALYKEEQLKHHYQEEEIQARLKEQKEKKHHDL